SNRWERWTWAIRVLRGLRKFTNHYDLIHFHLIWWGSFLAANWARRRNIPTIYESVLLDSDTPGAIGKEHFGRLKLAYLQKFTGIQAISDGIAADYLNYGFSPAQVHMQMNAIDTDLFEPLAASAARDRLRHGFKLPADALVLLFTGSLIYRKGVDLLIEAFISVAKKAPDLFLWLVGPKDRTENPSMDEAFVTSLQQKVAEAGLSDRVSFHGMIADRQRMAEAYQAADVFVFPSRKEGLPNVVLEAMACGLPVIVSDLPGLKNVIKPNENGIVVPIDNIQALATQIQYMIENPDKAQLIGQHAHMYIQSRHGLSAWEKEMSAYYHQLVRSGKQ
ncbi:MAG TPA: glycosyltransferase family 4 protein, partial [Chloroflexi bacterium]|nr:glycosyltransferase family 4 protein [Chloroflexota bacterium]